MSGDPVAAFVAQFEEPLSSLSVDNCITTCEVIANSATSTLFHQLASLQDTIGIITSSERPLSSRIISLFILLAWSKNCEDAKAKATLVEFGQVFAAAITHAASSSSANINDSITPSVFAVALKRLPYLSVWANPIVNACVNAAEQSVGEEDFGLQLSGELICLLCMQSQSHKELATVMSELHFFERIHQTVLSCLKPTAGEYSSNFLKRVVPVLYTHPLFRAMQPTLTECWEQLCKAIEYKETWGNCSIICCLLIDELAAVHASQLALWDIAFRFVEDTAMILRKRGLYIIERRLMVAAEVTPRALQWRQWITAYEAVSGSNQLHIVEQMWPCIIQLARESAQESKDNNSSDAQDSFPVLSFRWISLLLNVLIVAGASSIRRLTLARILRHKVPLQLGSDFVLWVCNRLLPALDQPAYFKHVDDSRYDTDDGRLVYGQFSRGGGSNTNNTEADESDVVKGEYSAPGVYLREFIRSALLSMEECYRIALLLSLITTICNEKALHTVNLTIDALQPFVDIPSLHCISIDQLDVIRSFLGERVLASNTTLLAALADTFVPLVLKHSCVDIPYAVMSRTLSCFTWAECFQRWVPEFHNVLKQRLGTQTFKPTDVLGLFTPILTLINANHEYLAVQLNVVQRIPYEPYLSKDAVRIALDAVVQLIQPVAEGVKSIHGHFPRVLSESWCHIAQRW